MRRVLPAVLGFLGLAATVLIGCGPMGRVVYVTPGSEAQSFLTSKARPKLVVEVTPVAGHTPNEQALNLLLLRATERCDKPGGISLVVDPEVAAPVVSGGRGYTTQDLIGFEAAHRKLSATNDTAVLYVEYLDGFFVDANNTLGVSFGPHSIAIFEDQLTNTFGVAAMPAIEGRVLVHEFGHELGLVNLGTHMVAPHEDAEHRGHDTNPACVMYWALHAGGSLGAGDQLPADDYCSDCKADLKGAGGH